MKYISAYLLCVMGGKAKPTAEDIKAVLESVGCKVEDDKLEALLKELGEKNITEVLNNGREKLSSAPTGGVAAGGTGGAAAEGGEEKKEEEAQEEEKVEEEESESDGDMGLGLFGSDDDSD